MGWDCISAYIWLTAINLTTGTWWDNVWNCWWFLCDWTLFLQLACGWTMFGIVCDWTRWWRLISTSQTDHCLPSPGLTHPKPFLPISIFSQKKWYILELFWGCCKKFYRNNEYHNRMLFQKSQYIAPKISKYEEDETNQGSINKVFQCQEKHCQ